MQTVHNVDLQNIQNCNHISNSNLKNGQVRSWNENKQQLKINSYLHSHNVGLSSNQKKRERKNMVENLRAINSL